MFNKKSFFVLMILNFLSFQNNYSMNLLNSFDGFRHSIQTGDVKRVEEYLKKYDCNQPVGIINEEPALIFAVRCKQHEVINALLKKTGEKSNFTRNFLKSFCLARKLNERDLMIILLKEGSRNFNVELIDSRYNYQGYLSTTLFQNDDLEVLKLFLDGKYLRGYTICGQLNLDQFECFRYSGGHEHYYNMLTYAVVYSSKKIIKYLLENKSELAHTYYFNFHNRLSLNNVILALRTNNDEVITIFIECPKIDWIQAFTWLEDNPKDFSKIKKNIKKDKWECINKIRLMQIVEYINRLANSSQELPDLFRPNMIDDSKNNIFHLAIEKENFALCKDVKRKFPWLLYRFNLNGVKPEHMLIGKYQEAIKEKNYDLFIKLVKNLGFENILMNSDADTILHWLIKEGWLEGIKIIILVAPILLDVKNSQGHQPVILSVIRSSNGSGHEVLDLLIKGAFAV